MNVAAVIRDQLQTLRRVIEVLNGNVEFDDNMRVKFVSVADTGPANTEFTVTHNLGKIPLMYVWNISISGIVYDSSKATWTVSTFKLKCSVANAALTLLVY